MEKKHILGMVCGYYLSRFDEKAYGHFGHPSQQATHEALGDILGVSAESIRNWRDEFDPVHDNGRLGWHRRPMAPSRRRTVEALCNLGESELADLIDAILDAPGGDAVVALATAIGNDDERHGDPTFALRGPTGIKAENAFIEFHERTGEPMRGKLVDRRHDQCGFDFELETKSGRYAIEVKGRAGASGGISFTSAEWQEAKRRRRTYFLALVSNVATKPVVSLIQDPASLTASRRVYTTVQVSWTVTHVDLSRTRQVT